MLWVKQLHKHMASELRAGFHQPLEQGLLFDCGGGMSSSSSSGSGGCQLIPLGNYYRNPRGSLNLSGNDRPGGGTIFTAGGAQKALETSSTVLLEPVRGLKHDTGLAAGWSVDEQYKLEEGLAKYASEPNIMRYIKIAASLRDKTVRDVALRCRWMTRKRRKLEDYSFGKKVKDRKDKLMESSLKNMSSASSMNAAPYSLSTNHHDQIDCMLSGGCTLSQFYDDRIRFLPFSSVPVVQVLQLAPRSSATMVQYSLVHLSLLEVGFGDLVARLALL